MFKVDLYRTDQGFQDEIEVGVLTKADERFLKSEAIQVDMFDLICEIKLVATLPDGRTVEVSKNKGTMQELFAKLTEMCKHTINFVPKVVH